jgi:hypothetical protein
MRDRYGVDQLGKTLSVIALVLLIANMFIRSFIMDILIWGILIWMNYRVFSKNLFKRQLENNKYLDFSKSFKKKFSLPIRRIKEIKSYRFRKCPHCKQVLRLKRKTGKHSLVCPRCKNKVNVRIWF